MSTQQHTGGRGGAGNIRPSKLPHDAITPEDLKTPTIKQTTYTTGRGGVGNMASNDTPEGARRAQDVEAPEVHQKDMKGTYHWGRGGEGNKTTIGPDGREQSKSPRRGAGERRRSSKMMEKGKEMLGFGEDDKKASEKAVAIEDD